MLRVVNWIDTAYQDIQNEYSTWRFLRESFSFSTIATTQAYTPAAAGISDLAKWITRDMRAYDSVADERWLVYDPWDEFRAAYMYGALRSQTDKPTNVSVKPDNSLILWPIPNDAYTIDGEYYKTNDIMEANDDNPIFPTRFHMIIVWKGLMHYGAYAGAAEKYEHGQNEYDKLFSQLVVDQLEDLVWGAPLA